MNKSAANAFINQVLVYTLVLRVFTGSIGCGTVWLRHEISLAANRNKNLQASLADVQRHLDRLTAEIAAAKNPDALIRLNSDMRLGLEPPRTEQSVPLPGGALRQFADQSDRPDRERPAAASQPVVFHRGRTR
jgi:hypothetical protein